MSQLGLDSDPAMNPKALGSQIAAPGGIGGGASVAQQELGYMASLYEIDVPMAWQITKGDPAIVTAVSDGFDANATAHMENQDLHLATGSSKGNFVYFNGAKLRKLTDKTGNFHGFNIIHQIAAEENGKGSVGVAPKSQVVAIDPSENTALIDVRTNQAGIQSPHVMNCSYTGGNLSSPQNSIPAGTVVVGALSNFEKDNEYSTSIVQSDPVVLEENEGKGDWLLYQYINYTATPGTTVFRDPNDSRKSYKVITAVGYNIGTGSIDRMVCNGYNQALQRGVKLLDNMNFSPRIEKFPALDNPLRLSIQMETALDLIVPYSQGLSYEFDRGSQKINYVGGGHGNSYAIPLVSGVASLMNAVHERLGVIGVDVQRRVYDIMTFTADKIQDPGFSMTINQALEAARKRQPIQAISPSGQFVNARVVEIPNKYMFTAKALQNEQWDIYGENKLFKKISLNGKADYRADLSLKDPKGRDPLKRWWGNRVGFGRLNAFRCVAHSIPEVVNGTSNVKQKYDNGEQLLWNLAYDVPGSARKFLHLGKFNSNGRRVLEDGGDRPADEPEYRNNNGTTIVNTNLTVGNAQTLVIDGIVGSTSSNAKISTSGTGRMLVTGWLQNVTLSGNIHATDLRASRTQPGGDAVVFTGADNNPSVLHDTLWVSGNSTIVVESGTLEMMPASVIIFKDNSKLVVKPGATLLMGHGAKIIDQSKQRGAEYAVTLQAAAAGKQGGKLVIPDNTELAIVDASVNLEKGAELSVGKAFRVEDTYPVVNVFLRQVVLQDGGILSTADGAIVRRTESAMVSNLVVAQGAKLTFPVGKIIKLDLSVDVLTGGTLEVPAGAQAKLGSLNVRSGASLIVRGNAQQGSGILHLLDETNEVFGKLIVEGLAGSSRTDTKSRAIIKAAQETSDLCAGLYKVPIVTLSIRPDKAVFPIDLSVDGSQDLDKRLRSYLHAQNAMFENVFTTVENVPFLERVGGALKASSMNNVIFAADRDVFIKAKDGYNSSASLEGKFRKVEPVLLSVRFDNAAFRKQYDAERARVQTQTVQGYWFLRPIVNSLDVKNSAFGDNKGTIELRVTDKYRELKQVLIEGKGGDYPVKGLSASIPISVSDCEFACLLAGIEARGRGTNRFYRNKFSGHGNGLQLENISATVCENTFSGCVNSTWSKGGTTDIFNNTFGGKMSSAQNSALKSGTVEYIGSACFTAEGARIRVLSNEMKLYGTALHAQSGNIAANDEGVMQFNLGGPQQIAVRGRNKFDRTGYESATNRYLLITKSKQESDIFFDRGTAMISCGKSLFNSDLRFNQLQKEKETGTITVLVKTNDFGVDILDDIRRNKDQVFVQGEDLRNGQYPYEAPCGFAIRNRVELDCAPWPKNVHDARDLMSVLGGANPGNPVRLPLLVMPADSELDPASASGLFAMSHMVVASANVDPETRMDYLEFAVRSAREHPSSDSAIDALTTTLAGVSQNQALSISLREMASLECAHLLAETGNYGQARQFLQTVDPSVFAGFDSLSVSLYKEELLVHADTVLTASQRDIALASISSRLVEHSKRAEQGFYKESLGGRGQTRVSYVTDLSVSVYPNPLRDNIVVRLDAAPDPTMRSQVDIRVLSLAGAVVWDRRFAGMDVGDEVVLTDLDLQTGSYILEAICGTSRSSTIISVVR
ncbi:MAG: hypothetical protein FGM32_10260 [Candidatus Kapabacteria bacterium]|nr:hypothetical protein [Candidatus Kapabacteria bacterium]